MNSEKEKLLHETYNKFLKISMNKLPAEKLDAIVAENIMAYGTAIDEKIHSLADCHDLVNKQEEQSSGLKFKREIIQVFRSISPEEDSAIFVDEMKMKIQTGKDVHQLFIRVTTILEYSKNKWTVVHFHTSKPDDTKGETDTWHIDEWKRKNEELQKLVEEKTADLLSKNRDLEIEASLERVRTVSMSMKKQDDLLEICETLFKELHSLGFNELRNAMINIFNDDNKTFVNHDFSDLLGKSITLLFYNIHPIIKKQIRQVRKSKDAYTETVFSIKDLADWKKFRKSRGEKDDPRLKKAKALHYYFYSVGTAAIGISTFSSISNEKKEILKRFRNVFDFAYRRYMDVTQAETQAREAKIEIALERVRSRTMAMQKSDELSDTAQILFQQFKELGDEPIQITIGIINEEKGLIEFRLTDWRGSGTKIESSHIASIEEPTLIKKMYNAWKEQKRSTVIELSGKELQKWIKYRSSMSGVKDKKDYSKSRRVLSAAFFSKGLISISSYETISSETIQLLERFAGVFDLTYTRFLDLKLAEEQTKEARIELALERVRARSMAMHSSEELVDASIVLFNELKSLGIESIRTGVAIVDESRKALEIWSSQLTEEKRNKILGLVPFKAHPFFEAYYKSWKKKEPYFFYEIAGKEVKKYYKSMASVLSYPDKIEFNKKESFYTFFFPEGSLNVVSKNNLTEDERNLMLRFAKVFGMIYRRFLDLRKAEAQAHEAQIEVALERVRSRTMAMHSSDELQEAAVLLFQQIRDLGVDTGSCGYVIWENKNKEAAVWMSSPEGGIQVPFKLNHTKSKIYKEIYTAKESGKDFIVKEVKGAELKKHFEYLTTVPGIGEKIRQLRKARYKFPETIVYNIAFFKQGYLSFHTREFSPEAHDIFKRFANVFEQTYTRFLDLQKAEAQTREAQIQLALERVRAKAMAMQKSDELLDVSLELYNQFKHLDSTVGGLTINIINEKEKVFEVSFGKFNQSFKLSIDEQIVMSKAYKCWKSGKKSLELKLAGKDLIHFNKIRNNSIGTKIFPEKYRSEAQLILYMAFFSNGMLIVGKSELKTEETIDILQRFASVFDLTYTRFLDLQKAEAQAKEARIETALEKVRSRSLAMHNAEELGEVISVVVEKLKELNFSVDDGVALITHIEGSKDLLEWMANPGFSSAIKFYLPYFEHPVLSNLWKAKNEGAEFVAERYTAKENKSFLNHIFKHSDFKHTPQPIKDYCLAANTYATSIAFQKNTAIFINDYSGKTLTQQEIDILKRFAKVFEQAYIRFLDLQKAEAQAKEAQIEAALERVRSRTMGMQKSEELKDVIQVIYEQFVHLNINIDHAGIIMDYKERDDMNIWVSDHRGNLSQVTIPYFDTEHWNRFNEAKKKGKDFFAVNLSFKEKNIFYKKLFKFIPGLPEEAKKFYFSCPGLAISTVLLDNVSLYIENFSGISYSDKENAILMRFGKVFQQTYTRFLDLQKAEKQAREAQIEAALERTRTQSMIMQHSRELDDTLRVFHEQVLLLGIPSEFSFLWLPDEEKDRHIFWVAWKENGNDSTVFKSKAINYPLDKNEPATAQCMVDWKSDEAVHSYNIPPTGVKNYFAAWSELFEGAEQLQPKYFKKGLYYAEAFMKYGCFGVMVRNELSEDEKKILFRFSIEFERTYSRFLDLQKAEAQAREAQIEAALERVRGKAMAMHNSNDLTEAAGQVFTELNNLGIKPIRSGFVLLTKESRMAKLYPATSFDNKNTVSFTGEFEFTGHPVYEKQYDIWQKKENYFPVLEGDLLKSYYKILAKGLSVPYENFPTDKKQFGTFLPFSEGFLFAWSDEPYSENEINILDRFKNILDLTIRRYIDLKNAEAQSRESQIEASLERVRSKAMAMQKSGDLGEAVAAIFEELDKLNLGTFRCGIGILDKEKRTADAFAALKTDDGMIVQVNANEPMDIHPLLAGAFDSWLKQENFSYVLEGEDIEKYYQALRNSNFNLPASKQLEIEKKLQKQYYFVTPFTSGGLFAFSENEFVEASKNILKRFADVINFTYSRFNDLKQAETQAKEAKIEAALERVRASSLIMRKPEDMFDVCKIISEQLILLSVNEIRNTQTVILNEGKETYQNYEFFPDYNEKTFSEIDYNLHPKVTEFVNEIKKSSDAFFTTSFEGKELQEWRDYRKNTNQIPDSKLDSASSVHYYFYSIGPGALGISTYAPLSEEQINIFKRFRNVFELAYRRYVDIEQAEAQAKEAKIEAALERVRSRTLAMQKSDELAETAAVVFKQLINLGIEPNRLYIGIIHNDSGDIEAWATDEDGSKVSKEFTLNINANASVKKMFDGWAAKKKSIIIDMQGKELEEYLHYISDVLHVPFKGGLSQSRRVQNIAYFSKGFIGIASPDPQPEETGILLERFAAVFNLTFTRFNDLQIAEKHAEQAELDLIKLQTEKKRAEEALTELRSTQAQLIQSEKMASLGELTAGIAHEIQNPLNFVNNFSEINTELIDELNQEINKGNFDEAALIAKDIKENEEKIKHHGKRAEGIVKGMLQHSRSSSGMKEPVNINALADEYLRLAYHGLRAKDKTFNAKMETDFDESIGEINVVPQDIGRVILNLITNAFYAVTEKKKEEIKGYEPSVEVSTKKSGDNVLISVKDNGGGIPQKVMEKIFQPFFTTKPTGQGTGLGLSMSYDIIKAHGGELKVETKEGEGAEFVISLPFV